MAQVYGANLIPTKILVPIDFSPSSHAALEQASALAQKLGAELHLVHVIPLLTAAKIPDFIPEAEFTERATKEAEARFAECRSDLAAVGVEMNSSVEVGGDEAACIMDVIEREQIDLLVISTHGITGWHPRIFGSIAEKLVRLAHIPVLLIRTPKPKDDANKR